MFAKRFTPLGLLGAALLLFLGAARAGEAAQNPRIPDLLPEGTVMLIHVAPWEQWANDFRQTAPAQIWNEPEVRAFLEGPWNRLSAPAKRAEQAKPAGEAKVLAAPGVAGEVLAGAKAFFETLGGLVQSIRDIKLEKPLADMLDSMARGPFTIAVRYSAEDARAQKSPAIIAIVGKGYPKDADAQLQALAGYLKDKDFKIRLFGTDLTTVKLSVDALSITESRGVKLVSIAPTQDGKRRNLLTLAFFNDRLLVSNDEDLCKEVIDGMSGMLARKLSDSALFKNCRLAGDEHMLAYLDIPSLQKALGAGQPAPAGKQSPLEQFLTQAGLNQATAVAWSLKLNGLAFESRTAIFTQGERQGFLGTFGEGQLSDDALKLCPANTPFAAGVRLKPDCVLPFMRSVFRALQGERGLANFDAVEKELAGRNLEKELGEAFSGEVVITSLAAQADSGPVGPMSAFAASLGVKDKDKAAKLLEDLLPLLAKKADAAGGGLKKFEGTPAIRYFEAPVMAGLVPVAPAFALQDERLIMAVDVPAARNALHILQKGPWLTKSENFTKALQNSGGQIGSAFSYVDWGQIYKAVFNVGTGALRMVAPTGVLNQAGIDLNLLPSTEAVASNLCPGLSVVRVENNGVFLASRSPVPSIEVCSPPLAAVTAVLASLRPAAAEQEKK
ncbi:MAG: hypothetical protein ABSE73_03910 [Planctomycetota bacterium]